MQYTSLPRRSMNIDINHLSALKATSETTMYGLSTDLYIST